MSQSLLIRNARRKDRHEMKACNERNLPENYDIDYWEQILTSYPKQSQVLCDQEGHVFGYLLSNGSVILSFAIDVNYRRKGWGQKILKTFLNQCLNPSISLHVRIFNFHAQHLYKKMGFRVIEEIPNYYNNPDENAFTMILCK